MTAICGVIRVDGFSREKHPSLRIHGSFPPLLRFADEPQWMLRATGTNPVLGECHVTFKKGAADAQYAFTALDRPVRLVSSAAVQFKVKRSRGAKTEPSFFTIYMLFSHSLGRLPKGSIRQTLLSRVPPPLSFFPPRPVLSA